MYVVNRSVFAYFIWVEVFVWAFLSLKKEDLCFKAVVNNKLDLSNSYSRIGKHFRKLSNKAHYKLSRQVGITICS